jgi:hypothetical protein
MFDFTHPFFRPLWLRVLVVALALGWALFEAVTGSPGWAIIFGGIGAVAFWGLLIRYDRGQSGKETKK